MEPESPRTRSAWPGMAAAAVAVVANLWVLGLDFSNDDFLALTRIPKHFVPEPWMGTDACSGAQLWYHEMVLPVPGRYLFRPATWALWWMLARIGVSAALFHGSVLAIHALATFLIYVVLRRATGPLAAGLAALTFGLAAGSLQAVTWVSATGDTLSVVFLALAAIFLQRGRERGSVGADIFAGLSFSLALASKESAAAFLPAVIFAALLVPRNQRPSPMWRVALCFLVPGAAFLLARWWYTRSWGPTPDSIATLWNGTAAFLGQTLAPWEVGAQDPLPIRALRALGISRLQTPVRILGAVITFLPVLLAIAVRPRRVMAPLCAIFVAIAIGIIPIAMVLLPPDGLQSNGISRAAYPITALFAAAIAFGVSALSSWPRAVRVSLVVPLLLWQAAFLVHVAGVEREASKLTTLRRSSLADLVAKSPLFTWFVAIEKPSTDESHQVPNGYWIEDAFKPPFVPRAVPVTWMPRLPKSQDQDGFDLPRCVREHRGMVQEVVLDDRGAYVPKGPPRPPLAPPLPEVVIQTPEAWTAYPGAMPTIAWDAIRGAVRHRVDLRLWTRGNSYGGVATVETREPRVVFDPDLFLTYDGRRIFWKQAEAAIAVLTRAIARPMIQIDFRISSFDGAGRPLGVSEWRTVYFTSKAP